MTTNEAINKNSNISVRSSSIYQQQGQQQPGGLNNLTANYYVNQVLSPNYNQIHNQFEAAMSPKGNRGSVGEKDRYVEVMQHVVISDTRGLELLSMNNATNFEQYQQQYPANNGNNINTYIYGASGNNATISNTNAMDISPNYNYSYNNNHEPNVMKQSSDRDILELLLESGVLNEEEDVLMSYTPSVNPATGCRWPENKGNYYLLLLGKNRFNLYLCMIRRIE